MAAAISVLLRDIVCQSLSISRSAVLAPMVLRHKAFVTLASVFHAYWNLDSKWTPPTLPQRSSRCGIRPSIRYGTWLPRNGHVVPFKWIFRHVGKLDKLPVDETCKYNRLVNNIHNVNT